MFLNKNGLNDNHSLYEFISDIGKRLQPVRPISSLLIGMPNS